MCHLPPDVRDTVHRAALAALAAAGRRVEVYGAGAGKRGRTRMGLGQITGVDDTHLTLYSAHTLTCARIPIGCVHAIEPA